MQKTDIRVHKATFLGGKLKIRGKEANTEIFENINVLVTDAFSKKLLFILVNSDDRYTVSDPSG